jgi:hypothetical protein
LPVSIVVIVVLLYYNLPSKVGTITLRNSVINVLKRRKLFGLLVSLPQLLHSCEIDRLMAFIRGSKALKAVDAMGWTCHLAMSKAKQTAYNFALLQKQFTG